MEPDKIQMSPDSNNVADLLISKTNIAEVFYPVM